MKRVLFLFPILMVFAVYLMAANPTSLPDNSSDNKIAESIKQNLTADEKLSGADIDVHVDKGVVTLKGKVLGTAEANRAIAIAKAVPGVVRVDSKIEIDTTITNDDVEDRLENNEEALEKQKEESEPKRSLGTVIDDATITAAVKLKLAKDDLVSAYKIDVDTKNGMVTLTGTVKSELEARRAIELAELVEGVKRVSSVLTVKPD